MNKKTILTLLSVLAIFAGTSTMLLRGADAKPKYTTKDVMKALHKGKENIAKRVMEGHGSQDDIAKLVEYYESLPVNIPPKGDKASWEMKANALFASAKAMKAGDAGALEGYKKAVNCKACHSAHREN